MKLSFVDQVRCPRRPTTATGVCTAITAGAVPQTGMKQRLMKLAVFSAAAAIGLISAATAFAATDTWTGGDPGSANWNDALNWNTVPGSGDGLFFAGSSNLTSVNNFSSYSFTGITFATNSANTNAVGAFILGGNPFSLAGGITNGSTTLQTINNSIALTGSQTINAASGSITLGGVINDGGNNFGLTKLGSQVLTLGAADTYGNTTLVAQGELALGDSGAGGQLASSPITVGQAGSGNAAALYITETTGFVTNPRSSLTINDDTMTGGAGTFAENYGNLSITGTLNGNTVEYFPTVTMQSGELRTLLNNNGTGENLQLDIGNLVRDHGTYWSTDRNLANSGLSIGTAAISGFPANVVNVVITNVNGNPIANALIGGGGSAGTTSVSVLPWATCNGSLATYDTTYGLRPLATSEMVNLQGSGGEANFLALTSTNNAYFSNSGTVTNTAGHIYCNAIFDTGNGGTINEQTNGTLTIVSGAIVAGVGFTFGTSVNDGFLDFGTAEGFIHVENNRTVTVNSSITGSGGLTISLDALNGTTVNCVLNGSNSYTGVTTFEGNYAPAVVHVNNEYALQNSTLDYNNYGASISLGGSQSSYVFGGLTGAQGFTLNFPLTIGGDNDALDVYSGPIAGTGSLNKVGTGALTLGSLATTGISSYTGGTTLTSGTLNLLNGGNNTINSSIGAGPFTILGGTLDNTSGSPLTLLPNMAQTWGGNFTFNGSSSLNLGTGAVTLSTNVTVTVNNNTLTEGGVISGGYSLTQAGPGTLLLTGANTYSGNTIVNGAGLALATNGSIANSPQIIVNSGALFDVSALSSTFTLGGSQSLFGAGTNNGSVSTSSGSKVFADAGTPYATNTFNNSLTLVSGATANFAVSTSTSTNDKIVVGGTLTLNGNNVNMSAPSTSSSLATADYTLATGTTSGSFAATPNWVVQPANFNHYQVETLASSVLLHYVSTVLPEGTGVASPSSVQRNTTALITVTVTNGSNPLSGGTVSLNAAAVNAGTVTLHPTVTYNGTAGAANVFTNTIVVGGSAAANSTLTLVATATDTSSLATTIPVSVTILPGTVTWSGLDNTGNWSDNANWVGGVAPLPGDSVAFGSATGTVLPLVMDQSFSLGSVTFNSGAAAFTITNASTQVLTLSAGITNNAANAQVLNMPVALATSQTMAAASGNLALGSVVSGSGSALTNTGSKALILSGANTYAGGTVVSGTVVMGNNTALGSGVVTLSGGSVSNSAGASRTLANAISLSSSGTFGVGAGDTLSLTGLISGGSFTETGSGHLFVNHANSFSSGATINSGTLVFANNSALGSGLVTVTGSGAISNSAGSARVLANPLNLIGSAGFQVGTNDTLSLSGLITNVGGLNISGTGTLTIGGSVPNTYSGGTVLNNSILDVENTTATPLGTGALSLGGGTLTDNGANGVEFTNNLVALANTSTLVQTVTAAITLDGNLSGPGGIVVNGTAGYPSLTFTGGQSAFTGSFTENNSSTFTRLKFDSLGSPNATYVFNNPQSDTESVTVGTNTIQMGALLGAAGSFLRQDATGLTTLSIGGLNTNEIYFGNLQEVSPDLFAILKVGTGTFIFGTNNSYSGPTEVNQGALYFTVYQASGSLTGPVQVDDGATLGIQNVTGGGLSATIPSLEVGTNLGATVAFSNLDNSASEGPLTVAGIFTNNGTCTIRITDTNNLQSNTTYTLINYQNYVSTGAGNFVLSAPPGVQATVTNVFGELAVQLIVGNITPVSPPGKLFTSLSGGVLSLSWPTNLGYGLQVQTDSVAQGLNPTNVWYNIPGSSLVTSTNININRTNGAVFYRMIYPPVIP
jgi:fibronectin-binding autotransporter adhesin